ncbi:hypothetical protein TSUD_244360 [Trifolium subterraneum]|uniref:Uncharacterized protein n=1 Tax=Trifolium subterraneum TaxID=3900 RepID=A0A2Z6NYJ2_TRISU|nr:hypothetical protein TSUD_244360 [Trifolium subterraneum]
MAINFPEDHIRVLGMMFRLSLIMNVLSVIATSILVHFSDISSYTIPAIFSPLCTISYFFTIILSCILEKRAKNQIITNPTGYFRFGMLVCALAHVSGTIFFAIASYYLISNTLLHCILFDIAVVLVILLNAIVTSLFLCVYFRVVRAP